MKLNHYYICNIYDVLLHLYQASKEKTFILIIAYTL